MTNSQPIARQVRRVFVTGASSGIGLAIARAFIEGGDFVVCLALNRVELEANFPERENVLLYPFDLACTDQIPQLMASLPAGFRDIDILVNCAGVDRDGVRPFHETDPAGILDTIGINLAAPMLLARAVLPGMLARGSGDIVNIGSMMGRVTMPRYCSYSASKFGMRGFSEALRADLGTSDIRVIEVSPSTVRTNFASSRLNGDAAGGEQFYEQFPDCLSAQDVADVVLHAVAQPGRVTLGEISIGATRRP